MIKLDTLRLNDDNPRTIRDVKFKQLVESIKNFPAMMRLRPMVVNADGVLLGGNMRYRACLVAGYTEVPDDWVIVADALTPDEQRRFIIEDNVQFGEWDWDALANTWNEQQLVDFGVDLPSFSVTDIPRPDFNDDAMDKGKAINAKDGNWFYVEFYGEDALYETLRNVLEKLGVLTAGHQLDADKFQEMCETFEKAQNQ
jgi:hypothetical protein